MSARMIEAGVVREFEKRPDKRYVVTGMGLVTPLGLSVAETWHNLKLGKSGISSIDLPHTNVKVAGVISGFDPEKELAHIVSPRELKRLDSSVQYILKAIDEALKDAGLLGDDGKILPDIKRHRVGIQIGTGMGGMLHVVEVAKRMEEGARVWPYDLLQTLPERVATVASMKYGLQGRIEATIAACASGSVATIGGLEKLKLGEADYMVVGGTEGTIRSVTLRSFEAAGALSLERNPERASRPFDKKRTGFVMAEGAGSLVVERLTHARKRNARIYAEVIGYGNTADASHDTDPTVEGATRCMRKALQGVPQRLRREGTFYINAHGTSTLPGDRNEPTAIKRLWQPDDYPRLVVSAPKSKLGHTMGAAGAVESVITIMALNEGVIDGTVNLDDPIDEVEGLHIPTQTEERSIDVALNNSFGFGGINSTIVFTRLRD